jgi:Protein of unknown function (DUF3558)
VTDTRGVAGVMGLAAALFVLAGCGGAVETPSATPAPSAVSPTVSPLPPRPVVLRLDTVNPCTLLTDSQRTELGVSAGQLMNGNGDTTPLQGLSCGWAGSFRPDNGYIGGAVLNHGAEFALSAEPVRSVGGFAATTTTSTGSDPNFFCGLLVDVAPGQALSAAYANNAHDYPGMNRQLACGKAQKLANDMLGTLRAQEHR